MTVKFNTDIRILENKFVEPLIKETTDTINSITNNITNLCSLIFKGSGPIFGVRTKPRHTARGMFEKIWGMTFYLLCKDAFIPKKLCFVF